MQRKILFTVLSLFSIWLFVDGISVSFYDMYSSFLSAVGAIITAVLIGFTIILYLPEKRNEKDYKDDQSGYFIFGAFMIILFGFGMFLINHHNDRREKEFKNYGKFAIATIVDGSSIKTRRADFSSIKVKFALKNGGNYHADIDISAGEFKNHGLKEQIPIVYSSRYPSLARILRSDSEISRYSHQSMRNITLSDLTKLFELKDGIKVLDYLNSVSQKWDYSGATYYNLIKNTGIYVDYPSITYIHSKNEPTLFENDLKEANYTSFKLNGKTAYTNGKFYIIKQVKNTTRKTNTPFELETPRTIVTMIKKE